MVTILPDQSQISPDESTPILAMCGITKHFPGTLALDNVDLTVLRGEIHALVGQNGAGKSTLVKILAGDYSASAGSIVIDGQQVEIRSTRDAHHLGIGIVYQELSLLPNLTVADNIFLGREPVRGLMLDQRGIVRGAREALARMGIDHIDPRVKVAVLDLAERQLVEIAKALSITPRILVLDEPTAPLRQAEAARLFTILRALRQQDVAIIYITHRFNEILSLCDRGTVLRGGRVVSVFNIRDMTLDRLVEATLGQRSDVVFRRTLEHERTQDDCPALVVRHLSVGDRVHDVSLEVRRGEVVSICGLQGSGQSEVGRALAGDRHDMSGTIEILGQQVSVATPQRARRLGIGFLSDERREEGLFPDMLTEENISIASHNRFLVAKLVPFMRKRALRRRVASVAQSTNVARSALSRSIRFLSGGNQQKAMLARWLMRDANILVFLEPTQGVDVGAKLEVYRQLEALAVAGKSVVVVSTDIAEALGLSDRIVVMHQGSISAIVNRDEATEEKIVMAMQGVPIRGGT